MKYSLLALVTAFIMSADFVMAFEPGQQGSNYSKYHSYDSSALSSDHSITRVNENIQRDEISDTASTGQAATKRDYYSEHSSNKKASVAGCKVRTGEWLRPQDVGYTECMNMLDTPKK